MDKVVDYLVYEQSQVRSDRVNRRLWILCIILTIFLFVSKTSVWIRKWAVNPTVGVMA